MLHTPAIVDEALGDVPRIAQIIWTSDQLYCPAGPAVGPFCGRELCSILNEAIRADDAELLAAVTPRACRAMPPHAWDHRCPVPFSPGSVSRRSLLHRLMAFVCFFVCCC